MGKKAMTNEERKAKGLSPRFNCDFCNKRFTCHSLLGGNAVCLKCYKGEGEGGLDFMDKLLHEGHYDHPTIITHQQ